MGITELNDLATDAWNRHDRDAYVALYTEDCEIVTPDATVTGHDGAREFWRQNADPFPDNRITARKVVTDGTTLVEESLFEGTNTGPSPMPDGSEMPATGKAVAVPYVGLHTARDELIASSHFYWDQLSFLQQLGVLPD
ncbi:ester cyclase [Pseudonocardia charpentierae]|uniref:Nuclear transport factor 2 family protein n=1 Tax=Pseudonocardia charpentierae TaxID=3075545 RepID=A0ABU2NBI6_9PSEU|nr:nuclear transport factor 2 family protein [Pseudonocardia sp. DSM 45834]MDT0350019.1 nuclear transport factor 2 family protein [Pseudonocardia sp. DSM 45834]